MRKGKYGSNSILAVAFLKRYAQGHGQLSPTGKGNDEKEFVQILSSGTTKVGVYSDCKSNWKKFVLAAI